MTDNEAIKITLDNKSMSIYELIQMAYENGLNDGRSEEREDAIDGINKTIQFIKDNSFDHKLECDSFKAIGSSVVIELLEQLKEKKA